MLGETPVREGPSHRDMPSELERDQGKLAVRTQDVQGEERPEWALPEPSEPCRRGGEDASGAGVPPQITEEQEREPTIQEYPAPQQRLIEADKRHRKRLAALNRDHIVKLREERQRMVYDWFEEYSMRASSAKLSGIGLSTLWAEYIHRYNRLLDREKQPHSDFFTNLTPDVKENLDFEEEEPFNLTEYDPHYEWD